MSGALPLFPLYAVMARTGRTLALLPFLFTSFLIYLFFFCRSSRHVSLISVYPFSSLIRLYSPFISLLPLFIYFFISYIYLFFVP